MLLTVIMVISGFIGRYFYTAVPHSADGKIMEVEQVNALIAFNQEQLETWSEAQPELIGQVDDLFEDLTEGRVSIFSANRRWRELEKNAPADRRGLFKDLRMLWERQLVLRRQLDSMAGARRLLAVWHTVHIPLGVVTFTIAFIHIGAALYYATFIH